VKAYAQTENKLCGQLIIFNDETRK